MPMIPIESPKPISTDVPAVSTNPLQSMGQTGRALEQVGNAVMGESLHLAAKIHHAEAVSASSEAHAQDMLDSQATFEKIKRDSPDGYVYGEGGSPRYNPDGTRRTITHEYRDWANDRYERTQLGLPTALAQQMYQERGRSFYTGEILKMQGQQEVVMAESAKASDSKMLQGFADNLVSMPDIQNAYQYSNTLSSSIMDKSGTIYPAAATPEMIRKNNQQIADSLIRGAHSQILNAARSGGSTAAADRWISVLDGTDPDSKRRQSMGLPTISDMMNPDEKAVRRDQLIHLKKLAVDMDAESTSRFLADAKAAYESGHPERTSAAAVNAAIGKMVALGKWKPNEAADAKASIVAAQGVGMLNTPAFAFASPADQAGMVKTISDKIYTTAQSSGGGTLAGSQAQAAFDKAALDFSSRVQSAKQSDFPAFAQSVDPSLQAVAANLNFAMPESLRDKGPVIQESIQKTQDYAKQSGIQTSWVVSKRQAEQLGATLSNPAYNVEQTASAVGVLRKEFGPYYPQLMEQLVSVGKVPETFRLAGYYQSETTTQNVISAIKGAKADDKVFDAVLSSRNVQPKEFSYAVNHEFAPWAQVMLAERPNDPQAVQSIQDIGLVHTSRTKEIYSGSSLTKEKASKASIDDVLGGSFTLAKVRGSMGWFSSSHDYSIRIPNQIASQPIGQIERERIVNFAKTSNSADGLKGFGMQAPPGAAPDFFERASASGYFALAQNAEGYHYFYTDPSANRVVPARTVGPDGKVMPLFVPIARILGGGP